MRRLLVAAVIFFTTQTIAIDEVIEPSKHTCVESLNACREVFLNKYCFNKSSWKRATRADEMGPFWANRGKKDPFFPRSILYADEPQWQLLRNENDYDPFFVTRGKKLTFSAKNRDRRNPDRVYLDEASPFLAARGKKDPLER